MLNVDIFFYEALKANDNLTELTEGRIFNTARTTEDDNEDKVPYCIIQYESGSSSGASTKDDRFAEMDSAQISIIACASSRDDLASLTDLITQACADAFADDDIYDEHDDWNFFIDDCTMSAGVVEYDPSKPCHYQTLNFECETSKR